MSAKKDIDKALKEAEKFMNLLGVEGVSAAKNKGQDCIKVHTSLPAKEIEQQLPKKIQGFEVVIEFTGPIQALDNLL
jgi:hypothetical protein